MKKLKGNVTVGQRGKKQKIQKLRVLRRSLKRVSGAGGNAI